jgi:hypothetical protein
VNEGEWQADAWKRGREGEWQSGREWNRERGGGVRGLGRERGREGAWVTVSAGPRYMFRLYHREVHVKVQVFYSPLGFSDLKSQGQHPGAQDMKG